MFFLQAECSFKKTIHIYIFMKNGSYLKKEKRNKYGKVSRQKN